MEAEMTDLDPWPDLLARTYDALRVPLSKVDAAVLDRPTPCAAWTVRDLVAHAVGTIDMFATGAGAPAPDRAATGTPVERLDAAVARNLAAWRAVTDPEAPVRLVFGEFPAATAAGLNQFESFVHVWDLAAALDLAVPLPDDLAETALGTAEARFRTRPRGDAFAPEVPAKDDTPQQRLLALTGRDTAGWPDPR
jgi:uncharacterized protein (TIGR03086 family)